MSMDERRLAELLHDAVAETPPPSFDEHDVARASERQRIRRRNSVVTGSAFGVVVLASATALGVALWTGPNSAEQTSADTAAAGGNATAGPNELPEEDKAGAPDAEREYEPQIAPSESRKQGRPSSGDAGPEGPGSTPSGCEQADRELAAALAGELPAAAPPLPQYECVSAGTSVSYRLPSGALTAMLLAPNSLLGSGSAPDQEVVSADATADDGRRVVIMSVAPKPGTPPYADVLDEWAQQVAARY
jgi:hypothetical protein